MTDYRQAFEREVARAVKLAARNCALASENADLRERSERLSKELAASHGVLTGFVSLGVQNGDFFDAQGTIDLRPALRVLGLSLPRNSALAASSVRSSRS